VASAAKSLGVATLTSDNCNLESDPVGGFAGAPLAAGWPQGARPRAPLAAGRPRATTL